MSGGSAYLWMAARARNALRRVLVFGIVGGVVFISALIAFVIVPRSASRKALAVAQNIEAPTDSAPTIAARDRYAAQINVADSILNPRGRRWFRRLPPSSTLFRLPCGRYAIL